MVLESKRNHSFVGKTFGVLPVWTLAQLVVIPHFNAYPTKWQYTYNVIPRLAINGLYILSFFSSVYYDYIYYSKNAQLILQIGNNMNMYLGTILMISGLLMTRHFNQLDEIFKNITDIDSELTELLGTTSQIRSIERTQFRFEAICIIAFTITTIAISSYDIIVLYPPSPAFVVLLDFVPYVYPFLFGTLITLQFMSLVKTLGLRIDIINGCLTYLLESCEKSNDKFEYDNAYSRRTDTNTKNVKRVFFIPLRNTRNFKKDSFDHITEHSLRKLFQLHDHLIDISDNVNRCYSTNTIIYVTNSFLLGMFGVFFFIKEIFYNYPKGKNLTMMATSYIAWSVQYISVIFILLRVCEVTRESAYKTPLIVHKIVQRKPSFMLRHDIYYNKMKSYTLHMLHRKNTFNFSGQGLFIFDYTFIFSAVSAGTSYLIVLLQFDMSFDHDRATDK